MNFSLRLLKVSFSSNYIRRMLFGIVVISLIAVSILSYWSTSRLVENGNQVEMTHSVISNLNSISEAVSDIAADVRNYTYTGVDASKAVHAIQTRLHMLVQGLDDLIPDNSAQQPRVIALHQILDEHFVTLDAAAKQNAANSSGFDTVLLDQQQQVSNASEQIIGEMSAEEQTVLLERQNASDSTEQQTFFTVALVAVSSILLLIFIYYSLDRETAKHQRAAMALRESEERSRAIVDTLIEGVLLINVDGTVAVMNPRAERMLTPAGIDGMNHLQLYQEDGTLLTQENYPSALALRTGKPQNDIILYVEHPDRGRLWMATNTQLLFHNGEDIPYAAVTSLSDITEQTRFQQTLEEARDQAIEASRAKSTFLATMSHEIRTPMNGIIGMTELVLDTPIGAAQKEMIEVIRTSAQNLLAIINDILDFSKVDAGKLTLESSEFQPLSLIESAADTVKPKVYEKKLSLMTFVDPAIPPSLCGDELRLRQILINLIGNAVKFTEQGEIVVRATLEKLTESHAKVRFSVKDTGIGLSETARQRLFQPFMQADDSMSRRYGGTGLGLAICARLVELMQGELGVESHEGVGSDFWFSVALKLPIAAIVVQPTSPPPADLHHLRVLVVDDNDASRDIINTYLAAWNSNCASASDGVSALHELRRAAKAGQPYDVALLDMVMPNMSGLTLANTIKQDALIAPIQLISLTSFQEDEYDVSLHEAKFRAFLTKPIKYPELLHILSNLSQPNPDPQVSVPVLPSFLAEEAKILVVEDNAINRKVATMQLQKLGWHVETASNGQEALDALAENNFSLVLMDCQMPGIDGFEATRRVRQLEAGSARHIPIIAMTANAMQGDQEACLLAGMDDYLAKPMNLPQIQVILQKWMPGPHLTK